VKESVATALRAIYGTGTGSLTGSEEPSRSTGAATKTVAREASADHAGVFV
jgi:hypothetical protein